MTAPTAVRDLAAIPGPHGRPVIGAGGMLYNDLLGTLLGGMHEYGDIVRYEVMPSVRPLHYTLVVAHHPDDVRAVLAQTERAFSKATLGFRVLTDLIGLGLLTTEGETWRRQRRVVQPLFTRRAVARYAELMADEAARLDLVRCPATFTGRGRAQNDAGGVGGPSKYNTGIRANLRLASPAHTPATSLDTALAAGVVDLHLAMRQYTLRVVGRALFSEDIDDTVPVLHRLVPELSNLVIRRTFQMFRVPLTVPTPRNLAARRSRRDAYAIVERIMTRSPDGGHDDDLLTRLRAARDPETGQPLSEREVADQIMVFLMAGHETTAGALTSALHLIGRHPDEQEKVAAEVAKVLAGRTAPSPEDLPSLVRTRAVLLEAMRLYPPVYLTERLTTEPVVLGGYRVPAGVMVMVAPWTTHRHPGFWQEPERFDPSRFLGEQDRAQYAYFPFGGGARRCVGEHFALLEATILLATLLGRYRVTALEPQLRVEPLVTLRPVGEVPARLELRTL